jgi:transposase
MDTYTQVSAPKIRRRYRTIEEKRRIVEEALAEGASVARVAQVHGVNANLVFTWRKLYQAGRLSSDSKVSQLLPVRMTGESSSSRLTTSLREHASPAMTSGTIEIQLQHARVRIEGSADPLIVRVLLECLRP